MKLTLLTQTRNTGYRLEEWIRFHAGVGVDDFLIYLDHPQDNSPSVLEQLSHEFPITWHTLPADGVYLDGPFNGRQGDGYQRWYAENGTPFYNAPHLKRQFNSVTRGMNYLQMQNKGTDHWTAFIDVDEFLVPQKTDNLKSIIKRYAAYYRRIVALDYRFSIPADERRPIIPQTFIRRPVSNAVHTWPTRKSIVKTKFCLEIKCLHDLDQSPYLLVDDELKLYHYRLEESFSPASYFIEDRRAIELLNNMALK